MEQDYAEHVVQIVGLDRTVRIPQGKAERIVVQLFAASFERVAPRDRIHVTRGDVAKQRVLLETGVDAFRAKNDHAVHRYVNRHQAGIVLRVAVHGSDDATTTANHKSGRAVRSLDPAGNGFPPGGDDDRWSGDRDRNPIAEPVDEIFG